MTLKGAAFSTISPLASKVEVCGTTVSGAVGVLLSFCPPVRTVSVPCGATSNGRENVTNDTLEPAFATLIYTEETLGSRVTLQWTVLSWPGSVLGRYSVPLNRLKS